MQPHREGAGLAAGADGEGTRPRQGVAELCPLAAQREARRLATTGGRSRPARSLPGKAATIEQFEQRFAITAEEKLKALHQVVKELEPKRRRAAPASEARDEGYER